MGLFNKIKTLIEEHEIDQAKAALTASDGSLTLSEQSYLEGLICAKYADWKGAKDCFMASVAHNPESPAKQALAMINDIYDFYYKDNLNP